MATDNFQQWNPGAVNQENDAAYTADVLRGGGLGFGSLVPSETLNKVLYQLSTMVCALADFMVSKGYNAQDGNLATLAADLEAALGAVGMAAINVVPYSATPAFNLALGLCQEITLTGNVASSTIAGVEPGQTIIMCIHQDGAGGHTFAWPPGIPGDPIDPGVSKTSLQAFWVDSASVIHPLTLMTVS
jgi:hypothetical protein